MRRYWLSCPQFTVSVWTDLDNVITHTAPITHRFVGQPLSNLLRWAEKFGKVEVEKSYDGTRP